MVGYERIPFPREPAASERLEPDPQATIAALRQELTDRNAWTQAELGTRDRHIAAQDSYITDQANRTTELAEQLAAERAQREREQTEREQERARHQQELAERDERIAAQVARAEAAETREAGWKYKAEHDGPTGLLTKTTFEAEVDTLLQQPDALVILLAFDVDDFKRTNDEYGHAGGDRVLNELAEHLRKAFMRRRRDDTLLLARRADEDEGVAGRLGGDEFAAVLVEEYDASMPGDASTLEAYTKAMHSYVVQVMAEFGEHMAAEMPGHWHGVSVGVAVSTPGRRPTQEAFFKEADKAMYIHKRTRAVGRTALVSPAGGFVVGPRQSPEATSGYAHTASADRSAA